MVKLRCFLYFYYYILSSFILLLILEIALRGLGFPYRIMDYAYDNKTGYSFMTPNQDYMEKWFVNLLPYRVYINSQGLRDNELIFKEGFKIFCIGDSFTFGTGVNLEDTFVQKLEKQLRLSFPQLNVEVINAGHGGASIDFEYEVLKQKGLPVKPNIVILQVYKNDVEDYFVSTRFKNVYSPWPIPFKRLIRHTAIYIQSMKLKLYILARKAGKDVKQLFSISESNNDFYNASDYIYYQEMWNHYFRKLQQVIDLCRENHFKLIILYIPDKYQVNNSYLKTTPQLILKEFAQKKNNTIIIDPLEILRKRFLFNIEDYFSIDGHLNAEGHEIISQLIYNALIENKMLSSSRFAEEKIA